MNRPVRGEEGCGPPSLAWTVTLFAAGVGLCIGSFLLFQAFSHRDLGIVQPLDGTDRLLVGDPAVTGSRTITRIEYFAPLYLAQLAPWLGGIGLATIVANTFRLSGFELVSRRAGAIDGGSPRRTTPRTSTEAKES